MKLPSTVYVTAHKGKNEDDFLLVFKNIPDSDQELVGEYRLVRKGRIHVPWPKVLKWGK